MSDRSVGLEELSKTREEIPVSSPVVVRSMSAQNFFLEMISPGLHTPPTAYATDVVAHVFASPEWEGPWFPQTGGEQWITTLLGKLRSRTSLNVPEGEEWCMLRWERDGVPELTHYAVRQAEASVDAWLEKKGWHTRMTGRDVLNNLQDVMYPEVDLLWLQKRSKLLGHLSENSFRDTLIKYGAPVEETDPDVSFIPVMDVLPGSWFIRFFRLKELVLDTAPFFDALDKELQLAVGSG